jgi:hypothetical protein
MSMGRIGRSFQLVGQSYRVLMQDKELMILPLISGTIVAIVVAGVAFGFGISTARIERHGPDVYLPLFIAYIVSYGTGIFFQAAVVAGATERMRGGDPTIASALAAAGRRIGAIFMWAVVAATVGIGLRAIQDRLSFVGKIVAGLLGAAWSLATFFVVPVLVLEERSVGESFTRSAGLFKRTWGETFTGGLSLGIAAVCAWVTLFAIVGVVGYSGSIVLTMIVFGAGAILLLTFFSALQGIYVASLYRYATEGEVPSGFDGDLLKQAFVPKKS